MRGWRAGLMIVGVLAAAYGVTRLLELPRANTRATVEWLVGGVVLHDALFAPAVLVVSLVALQVAGAKRLAPVVVVLVILVPVTLVGIPELGRYGARADRPTLLDRDYWLGWWVLVTLVTGTVLLGSLVLRRRHPAVEASRAAPEVEGGDGGAGDGRR
jgi:hypothetical protein